MKDHKRRQESRERQEQEKVQREIASLSQTRGSKRASEFDSFYRGQLEFKERV